MSIEKERILKLANQTYLGLSDVEVEQLSVDVAKIANEVRGYSPSKCGSGR